MPDPDGDPPIHLKPNAAVAERALLPGDPGRALRLAQHLLAAPMQVLNTNRGLWGYTGTAADGAPLTIQSTGMGGPSTAIVAEELIVLGARRLVRVGTCGALAGGRALGDLLVAGAALCVDGTSRALGGGDRAEADPELTAALERAAGARGRRSPRPTSSTTPTRSAPARWAAAGAVAIEMEASTLFTLARLRGVAAGCVLTVSDVIAEGRRIDDDALHAAELRLGDAAVAALGGSRAARPSCGRGALGLGFGFGFGLAAAGFSSTSSRSCSRGGGAGRRSSADASAPSSAPSLAEVVLDRGEALVGAAERRALERLEPLVEPVDAVLDPLEPLRDRPQAPGQALDVGGGRDVERAHRGLLRLDGALAGAEGARDRGVDERVLEQVLGELAHRVLARARELVAQALAVVHRISLSSLSKARSRLSNWLSGALIRTEFLPIRAIRARYRAVNRSLIAKAEATQ